MVKTARRLKTSGTRRIASPIMAAAGAIARYPIGAKVIPTAIDSAPKTIATKEYAAAPTFEWCATSGPSRYLIGWNEVASLMMPMHVRTPHNVADRND